MSLEKLLDAINYETMLDLVERFSGFGPLGGILLAMIEAFFPPLPLSLIVTVNVVAYGFGLGYLYSWLGTFLGSMIVFFLIRKFGRKYFSGYIHKHAAGKFAHLLFWIKKKGFMPLFIMLTFPFTPSIVVCILAGLADVRTDQYVTALFFGKLIMVLSLSFIGYNVGAFVTQPLKSGLFIAGTLSISFIARAIIKIYERKVAELHRKHEAEAAEKQ